VEVLKYAYNRGYEIIHHNNMAVPGRNRTLFRCIFL